MKNLLIFYTIILLPLPVLAWLAINDLSLYFVIGAILYIIYRNFTDGYRLYLLGLISKNDILKFKPIFLRAKYFPKLYFGK
ncbi:hypothetical protein GCM10023230_15090 [Flavobacterium hankyongi]|jgi:hypothetical protein|uniref:Uncharacterized protein n=1 Tax=Flavobacterium hankyongi TaxID=1176532 RepID=A0ABP8ZUU2_9FLAO